MLKDYKISSSSLVCLLRWSKRHRGTLILYSILSIIPAALSLYISLIIKDVVNSADSGLKNDFKNNIILLICVIVLQLILGFILHRIHAVLNGKLTVEMRTMVIDSILCKNYASLTDYHSGELVNRSFSDVSIVVNGILDIFPPLLGMVTQLVGASIILFMLSPFFLVVLFSVGFVLSLMAMLLKSKMKGFHKAARKNEEEEHAAVQEAYENIRIIKASDTHTKVEDRIYEYQKKSYLARILQTRFSAGASLGMNIVFRIGWLYSLIFGCVGILNKTLSYGMLMAIMQLVGQIQVPFTNFSSILGLLYAASSSADRLNELMMLPNETTGNETIDTNDFKKIEIKNLSFTYDRDTILDDVSLTINSGDFVAISGVSGSGKSTLFSLLLSLYKPITGSICYKIGDNLHPADFSTRRLFSYVPQGNSLFSGTLRENLLFFSSNKSDEEILSACENACISDFISSLDNGLDTYIGEHSIGLSEGQAQRIAVARALLSDAPVLLFDESTSALDEQTEAKLLENISKMKNKTCLIVTHRKAALEICNRHIKVEGQMVTE